MIKSIEQILNVMFKYKPKRNVGLLRQSIITYFHLDCQNLIKKHQIMFIFASTILTFFPNLWNVNLSLLKLI